MPTNREVNLDVAKGILIILVILNHVSSQLIIERDINPPFLSSSLAISDYLWVFIRQSIYFAIPLFLFISGYVLTQAHMVETPLRIDRFYRRRLKRIYIPFLLWLSVYMLFFWDKITIYQVLMSLVFLEGNFHFWYLWVICILYLAFPWLLLAVQKNAAMVVLGMGLLVVLALTLKDKPWTDSYTLSFIMQNKILILPENSLYFLMGMLTAIRLEKNFRQYPSSKPLLILLILIGVGAFLGRWRHFFDRSFIGDPRGYYAINLTYGSGPLIYLYFLSNAAKKQC